MLYINKYLKMLQIKQINYIVSSYLIAQKKSVSLIIGIPNSNFELGILFRYLKVYDNSNIEEVGVKFI